MRAQFSFSDLKYGATIGTNLNVNLGASSSSFSKMNRLNIGLQIGGKAKYDINEKFTAVVELNASTIKTKTKQNLLYSYFTTTSSIYRKKTDLLGTFSTAVEMDYNQDYKLSAGLSYNFKTKLKELIGDDLEGNNNTLILYLNKMEYDYSNQIYKNKLRLNLGIIRKQSLIYERKLELSLYVSIPFRNDDKIKYNQILDTKNNGIIQDIIYFKPYFVIVKPTLTYWF
jgi:hypothetical protein